MSNDKTVFSSPWFSVVEKAASENGKPYYVIDSPDFAVLVATDTEGRLLLVRQYRPAVERFTLELPAGHVEQGETPEETARKELLEETGYEAGKLELIAKLSPSTARFRSTMWCFWAPNATRAADAEARMEAGMSLVVYEKGWRALVEEPDFSASGSHAALLAAIGKGKLR